MASSSSSSPRHRHRNIMFLHPDLGIGGAERLILDAALSLQSLGHRITIYTSHRDPTHCFDEARDGTLDVRVRGNTLIPATLPFSGGRGKILCAVLRQLHLLLQITILGELGRLEPDVFFVDQLAAGVPVLRWWCGGRGRRREGGGKGPRVLFYCHFPDLLLVKGRRRWWVRGWRLGFDWLEGWGMRCADRVVVNSRFTKGVVEGVWPDLGAGRRGVGVVYPCVDTKVGKGGGKGEGDAEGDMWKGKKVVLSINRFERKKNIALALRAFHGLQEEERRDVRLVLAGGYDPRVEENVRYHEELVTLAEELRLRSATTKNVVTALSIPDDIQVLFLLSVPAQLKTMLLSAARLLIYTPTNEHFGIVPLEAMLAGVPVLAADSGGPLETVLEGKTGWLRDAEDVAKWTETMRRVLWEMSDEELQAMGAEGKKRVGSEFSERKLAARLDEEIEAMLEAPRQEVLGVPALLLGVGFGVMVLAVVGMLVYRLMS
ncbi:MAG: hypothetical protein Q9208_000140 [Pyrenodesmia sp. 3 TL-2023]